MPDWEGKRPVQIVTACLTAAGTPDFALNTVAVTRDEYDNAIHYYLAEADLLQAGYEEPFVHFDEFESPAFLHAAVQHYLRTHPDHPMIIATRETE
jgi:hypothetical protein